MPDSKPTKAVKAWMKKLEKSLAEKDTDKAVKLFGKDSYWRDLVSLTWNIKTVEGRDAIADMLNKTLASAKPRNFQIDGEANEADGVTDAWFTFETATGRGKGLVRLIDGKAWTMLTTLQELKGFEERKGEHRPMGVQHGAFKDRETWAEARAREEKELGYTRQPYCLIIGGGQGGIALGARLKRLGVPTIIIEKNDRPGDSWRKRYKSLCLHDPVWYDHLPYLPFPDHWPVFSPKDKIGDWLEMYTKMMELNYWTKSEATSATWDDKAKEWTVKVKRDGKEVVLKPKATRPRDRHVRCAEHSEVPRSGCLQGRTAAFQPAPRPRQVQGQEGRRDRLEQFRSRHLRSAVGNRCRRDHGAAFLDPYRQIRHADGCRSWRALLRSSSQEWH
jgi:putative flavoprotein involved in K+ transport